MNLTKKILLLSALLACPMLFARVNISLRLNRVTYMQYEPVFACVTLRNDTGRALLFGKDARMNGKILFDLRNSKGRQVARIANNEINVTGLMLAPGEVKNMIIPVQKHYDIDQTGTYTIAAYISHSLLPETYQSASCSFRVEPGITVWERTVGLPDLDGNSREKVKYRTYSMRTLTESSSKYYYLRVEDKTHVYGVMRVGQVIGREKFQVEVDMLSRIHLLMPLSPRIFHYLTFSLDGLNTANSYWRTSETIPMLYRDEKTGKVTRIGGVEAKPGIDFKDPDAGKLTATKLLDQNGRSVYRDRAPKPWKDSGIVDLGKGLDIAPKNGESDDE